MARTLPWEKFDRPCATSFPTFCTQRSHTAPARQPPSFSLPGKYSFIDVYPPISAPEAATNYQARGTLKRRSFVSPILVYHCLPWTFSSKLTIHWTANLSVAIPKYDPQNVFCSGIVTFPPSAKPLKILSASFWLSVLTDR